MLADELHERRRIRLPIGREALEILEHGVDARCSEEADGILGVFIEVRVEDSLVHEIRGAADVEQHPAQIVQLQYRQAMRIARDGLLDLLAVCPNHVLSSRNDL